MSDHSGIRRDSVPRGPHLNALGFSKSLLGGKSGSPATSPIRFDPCLPASMYSPGKTYSKELINQLAHSLPGHVFVLYTRPHHCCNSHVSPHVILHTSTCPPSHLKPISPWTRFLSTCFMSTLAHQTSFFLFLPSQNLRHAARMPVNWHTTASSTGVQSMAPLQMPLQCSSTPNENSEETPFRSEMVRPSLHWQQQRKSHLAEDGPIVSTTRDDAFENPHSGRCFVAI